MTEVLTQILGGYYSAWSALRFRAAAAALTRPIPRALATPNWVRMCAVLTQVVEADAAYWSLRFLDVSLWSVMRTADALDKQFTLIADQLASVVRKMSRAAVTRDPRVKAKIVVLRQTHTLLRIRLSALPYYRWLATDPDIATFDRTRVATQTLVSEHVGKLRHPWLSGRMTRLMVAELGALHRICTARDAMMRHQLPQAMCELHRCRSTLAAWSEQWDRDASSAPSQSEDGAAAPPSGLERSSGVRSHSTRELKWCKTPRRCGSSSARLDVHATESGHVNITSARCAHSTPAALGSFAPLGSRSSRTHRAALAPRC